MRSAGLPEKNSDDGGADFLLTVRKDILFFAYGAAEDSSAKLTLFKCMVDGRRPGIYVECLTF